MEKTKESRLSETIVILKKLLEVGVPATDAGYKIIKAHMSKWVEDGEAVNTTVPLMRYGRDAILVLPATAEEVASCRLKAV
jgi:hypothetical protein